MGRKISPVTERRRARRAARAQCKAEGRRVKQWVPEERKRVAGLIAQMRAHGQQQIGQLRAQTAELVKLERDRLAKRVKDARAAARLGKCVDLTAGPALHVFGPKRPPKGFRPPPPGSRAANPEKYDQRSRELVSETLDAQRRASALAKDVRRGFAYDPRRPSRPLRKPGAKKAGVRALKRKGKVRAVKVGAFKLAGGHVPARTNTEGRDNALIAHEQLLTADWEKLFAQSDAKLARRLSLAAPAAVKGAREFYARHQPVRAKASRSLPPAPDLALARQDREVRLYNLELAQHARRTGTAARSSAPPPSKSKKRKSTPPKPRPGKAPPDQYRVQYRGTVKLFKGKTAREKAQADAEFQSSRYAGTATVSQRIGPGPNGWEVYDRWQGSKHSHKSSSDRANGRL